MSRGIVAEMEEQALITLLDRKVPGSNAPSGSNAKCLKYALYLFIMTSPESKPALKQIAELCQVWRHIAMNTVLTQEEIPE